MLWPALLQSASAATVCASVSCDYVTIRAALEQGESFLELSDAAGYEDFELPGNNKTITIIGTDPYSRSAIVPLVNTATAVTGDGGTLILEHVDIAALYSHGIDVSDMDLVLTDVRIHDCSIDGGDGGALRQIRGTLLVTDGQFDHNSAARGGALHLDQVDATVAGALFNDNYADGSGGAILADGGSLTLDSATLTGNVAAQGGAVSADGVDVTLLGTTTFDWNGALGSIGGAALLLFEGAFDVPAGATPSFDTNTAQGGGNGGAINAEDVVPFDMSGGSFDGNIALAGAGGHVALSATSATFTDVSWANGQAVSGGAIYVEKAGITDLTLIDGCTATSNSADDSGGVIYFDGGTGVVSISGFTADGNFAVVDGGGLYVRSAATVDLDSVTFVANTAGNSGGGVYTEEVATLTIDDSQFTGANAGFDATFGGAIQIAGFDDPSALVLHNVQFEDLHGGALGGAIRLAASNSTLDASDCDFTGVSADLGGGAVSSGGSITMRRSRFCDVNASQGGALSIVGGNSLVENAVFVDATSQLGGAIDLSFADLTLRHSVFRTSGAFTGGGVAQVSLGSLTFEASLIDLPDVPVNLVSLGSSATFDAVFTTGAMLWAGTTDSVPTGGDTNVPIDWLGSGLSADLWCGIETRLHPLAPDGIGVFVEADGATVTDAGAYDGPEASASARDDADSDANPWRYDCDEAVPTTGGWLPELCDNYVDDDCDGLVDALDPGMSGPQSWYFDGDGDGSTAGLAVESCTPPGSGWTTERADDCDDTDPAVFPGAFEVCNGIDDDCDGEIDERLGVEVLVDADGDGFVPADAPVLVACEPVPGTIALGSEKGLDCDDTDEGVNPEAVEIDGDDVDQNCDGADAQSWIAGGASCGCDGGQAGGLGAAAWLLALVATRRHRRG